jgi:hypothetical protein
MHVHCGILGRLVRLLFAYLGVSYPFCSVSFDWSALKSSEESFPVSRPVFTSYSASY